MTTKTWTVTAAAAIAVVAITIAAAVRWTSASNEDGAFTAAEVDQARDRGEDFLTKAGNYGLTADVLADPKKAMNTPRNKPSSDYTSRALTTLQLRDDFLDVNAIGWTPYAYRDEAGYNPYRVSTTVSDVQAANGGEGITGEPTVKVTARLDTTFEFIGFTQGYLDKNDKPVPASPVRVTNKYSDNVALIMVRSDDESFRVVEIKGLNKIRVLAIQDDLGFHDDSVIGLPEPDSSHREVITKQGAK